ncbi:unnamed protein product [Thelazia callipaeda]|uniref:Uncharacterized protein n=1 Tax=Thelazia callipaeda TaxID=103827 RepID=A0A0N5CYT2_THECL|nr:unnamed protein product [Thelazia callipaeda]
MHAIRDSTESDQTVIQTVPPPPSSTATRSVLSSCEDQALITTGVEVPSTGGLLSVNPALIDPAIDPSASFSDQGEFELPPPMSELSSAVADAAASRNTSIGFRI